MTESRFDDAVQAAWGKFEAQVGRNLDQLGDGTMIIEVEAGESQATPYVQFAGDDHGVRGEVSSNRFLDEACRLDRVQKRALVALGWNRPDDEHPNWWVDVSRNEMSLLTSMTVGALRTAIGVVHPEFLVWDGEPVEPGHEPGLEPGPPELGFPTSREELSALVDATVRHHLELTDDVKKDDDDGDIAINCGKVPLWIRVLPERATVRIFSHVVINVINTRQARIEADILNRHHPHLKFTVEEHRVVATVDLDGSPFVAQHLRDLMDLTVERLLELADDLALRTGGRLFFSSSGASR